MINLIIIRLLLIRQINVILFKVKNNKQINNKSVFGLGFKYNNY